MKRLVGTLSFVWLLGAGDVRADSAHVQQRHCADSLEELRGLSPGGRDRAVLAPDLQRRRQAVELSRGDHGEPADAPVEARARFWLVP